MRKVERSSSKVADTHFGQMLARRSSYTSMSVWCQPAYRHEWPTGKYALESPLPFMDSRSCHLPGPQGCLKQVAHLRRCVFDHLQAQQPGQSG